MNKKVIAIAKLSSAIQYLTWAIEEEPGSEREKEWIETAQKMIELANLWIER